MTIRISKRLQYVVILTVSLQDIRLSFRARGILAYLLSKPDNWKVSERYLATQSPEGITAVRAGLTELSSLGYLVRERRRGADGKFEWEQTLYEQPLEETQDMLIANAPHDEPCLENLSMDDPPCLGFPRMDEPRMGEPCMVNPLTLINEVIIKEDVINEEIISTAIAGASTPDGTQTIDSSNSIGSSLIACFLDEWQNRYKRKPASFPAGRVGSGLKSLHKNGMTEAHIKNVIRYYIHSPNHYFERQAHSGVYLINNFDAVCEEYNRSVQSTASVEKGGVYSESSEISDDLGGARRSVPAGGGINALAAKNAARRAAMQNGQNGRMTI